MILDLCAKQLEVHYVIGDFPSFFESDVYVLLLQ